MILSISVLNGFQGILQNEAKKLYGDYLIEDLQNFNYKDTFQDSNIDKMRLSVFQEDEFLIIAQNKQKEAHQVYKDWKRAWGKADVELSASYVK